MRRALPLSPVFFLALVAVAACGGQSKSATNGGDTASLGSDSEDPSGKPDIEGPRASGSENTDEEEQKFQLNDSTTAKDARGENPSKIEATKEMAAVRFFVINKKNEEPIAGVVISMEAPDGTKFYTEETDSLGFGEVLVPIGKKYRVAYLSLGRKDVTAKVEIPDLPRQNIKLTLRYRPRDIVKKPDAKEEEPKTAAFRLDGITFKSGSATLTEESSGRLDEIVEFMTHKKSARIEVSGHTDSVGNPKKNKALSKKRAEAVKAYLVKKGIASDRVIAVGHGDEQPIASNATEEGREQNRRIEAKEIQEEPK